MGMNHNRQRKYCVSKKAYLSTRQAFTLVEVMLTVAIIGILAGVVLVNNSNSTKKAKMTKIKTTLASLEGAIAACCFDKTSNSSILQNWSSTSGSSITFDICKPVAIGSLLPTADQLGVTKIRYRGNAANDCSSQDPQLTVFLYGSPDENCNDSTFFTNPIVISRLGISSNPACMQ